VDKIELDIIVLSLVNDHYAALEAKKEQARAAAEAKAAGKGRSKPLPTTPVVAQLVLKSGKRKVLSESECRTNALLKAICKDGTIHVRPLCNSADILLALHELLDPAIFVHGYIQLPHVLSDNFQRHTEGYYRYTHIMNTPGRWQYFR
jgi:hypothetical protein